MKTYTLKSDGGKIASALADFCSSGHIGESLLRGGVNQEAFNLVIARYSIKQAKAGKTVEDLAAAYSVLSACNASAAKQALAGCTVTFDGDKAQSVADYWNKSGGSVAKPDLSKLDL